MSEAPMSISRTASPTSTKQVAFDHKCQVIPEGDCAELRKLLSLCPTRAQSPPIVGPSSRPGGLIARAISPPFARAKSPNLKKASSGLGNAAPSSSTSWKTRLTSWGSIDTTTIAGSLSAAFGAPTPSTSSAGGPRLVAPVPARGTASPMIPSSDDDDSLEISPSNESEISFEDIDAEFKHAVSGVAMHQHHAPVATVLAGPSAFQAPRPSSPMVYSIGDLPHQRPASAGRPKSCLVRSKTPQAPGPPSLLGKGTGPLRTTMSHDRDSCLTRRRRAEGVPVVCPSPLSSPDDERGPSLWGTDAPTNHVAKSQKLASGASEKSKISRWRRFRRAASEDSQRYEPSSSSSAIQAPHMDEVAIKRQIQAGRWPFEAPLNAECSCKNCQDKIEGGLASDYEPKWTRAARIRWLEAQEDAAAQSPGNTSAANSKLPRSTSRTAIQADEVAQLHNETVHPMTAAELAAEPASPCVDRDEPSLTAAIAEASSAAVKPPNPTGLEEGDDTLRREIIARRQRAARQSPVMRHGARSMLRQIEEAERREEEAARDRARSRGCGSGTGSGRSSPASPAMSPSLPSTPESESAPVSTAPQERGAEGKAAASSYFELQAPPQRVRSPLIPVDEACRPRYARLGATDSPNLSMTSVAQCLENLASPTISTASNSPSTSPRSERRIGSASIG